jgi:glutamate/aspartate transport system substrate-binding protein
VSRIFISHRHTDAFDAARRLATTLKYAYKHSVFIDEHIDGGTLWSHELEREVRRSDAMIVLIGPDWLDARDEKNNRRLDDPEDYVRKEVTEALKLGIFVLPVLLNGAPMPSRDRLPEPLQGVAGRQAMHLNARTRQFETDVKEISKRLDGAFSALRRRRRLAQAVAVRRILTRVSTQIIAAWKVLVILCIGAVGIYFLAVYALTRDTKQLNANNAESPPKAPIGRLEKIKERGSIIIGYRDSSIPFSYKSIDDSTPIGFSIEICNKIVDAIRRKNEMEKLKTTYKLVISSNRFASIKNGDIDLECGSTTNNNSRKVDVDFTNTHFITRTRFASKKIKNIKSKAQLAGKILVAIRGTTNVEQLNNNGIDSESIRLVNDHKLGFRELERNRAVAFFLDDILLRGLIANSERPSDYVLSEETFSEPQPYGIMLPKDDPALKEVADNATAALYESPEIFEIYNKWFKKPILAYRNRGTINLNFDMPPELKKAFAKPTASSNPQDY